MTAFDPWDPAFVADPYPAYAELRARGRVVYYEPTNQWLVPHHADVSALLRDRRLGRTYQHRFTHEDFGRTAPPAEHEPFHTLNDHGMLDLEPPDHTRIRRLVSKAFTPRTVERLRPYVEGLAGDLVDRLVGAGGPRLGRVLGLPARADRKAARAPRGRSDVRADRRPRRGRQPHRAGADLDGRTAAQRRSRGHRQRDRERLAR